ncbi:MAG: dTMP kinase [Spirulinaceae cyanobacterium SM2_1_0]|nr:dTMP kinase [Spirulinaceae cyanobacterium SM2_1_0]
MPKPATSCLIVFEGGEGAGKSTQLQQALAWLPTQTQQPVMATREPGGTPLGRELRQLLLSDRQLTDHTELLLYAADRAQHIETVLRPALAAGYIVLCDRFIASTIAYQGYGRGLDLALIEQLNRIATDGLTSDLTLWFDLEVTLGLQRARQRGERDRIEAADLAFHQRVRQGFASLAAQEPERFTRIDASGSIEMIAATVRAQITRFLELQSPHD